MKSARGSKVSPKRNVAPLAGDTLQKQPASVLKRQDPLTRGYIYAPPALERSFPIRADLHLRYIQDGAYTVPHLHNCFEIGCCHSGGGVFLIADKVRSLRAGDCVVINDREPHCAFNHPSTPSEWSWLYIEQAGLLAGIVSAMPHTLPITEIAPFCGPRFENVLTPERNPLECALVRSMVDELHDRPQHYRDTVRHALFLLLANLHRSRAVGRIPLPPKGDAASASYRGTLERLEPAMAFIGGHYAERIEVGGLARMCSMGPEHFRRMFRRTLGATPKRYIINMRVARACLDLRNTRHPIGIVALRNGFPDVSCFNREFRRQFSRSPREWRKTPA